MRRFLVDNQLPVGLARWFESKGCRGEHVFELQLAQASDQLIWERAAQDGSVIVSKDEDFAQMTLMRSEPVAVIWLRMGNCRTPTLFTAMERAWPDIVRELDTGARLLEVF